MNYFGYDKAVTTQSFVSFCMVLAFDLVRIIAVFSNDTSFHTSFSLLIEEGGGYDRLLRTTITASTKKWNRWYAVQSRGLNSSHLIFLLMRRFYSEADEDNIFLFMFHPRIEFTRMICIG